jgi:photosystem II stability/assembly factor-like uncharacterized protein
VGSRGRRILALLGALIALVPLATAPVPASAAPPSAAKTQGSPPARLAIPPTSGWTFQNPSPHANTLLSVSCPTATTCYAAGYAGVSIAPSGGYPGGAVYVTTDSGAHWALYAQYTSTPLWGISCPDASHCMTVGPQGLAFFTTGNSIWSGQRVAGLPFLLSVNCPSVTTCVAVGVGGTIIRTTDFGANWTAAASPTTSDLYGVTCAGATTCMAVGIGGAIVRTTDGVSWSSLSSTTSTNLYGISCPIASTCMAVGGHVGADLTNDGGNTWQVVAAQPLNNVSLDAVSCPDTSHCFSAGADGAVYFWASQASPMGFASTSARGALYGISCPVATSCFAVGEFATIVQTTNGGTGWTKQSGITGEYLTGLACPSTTTCFASGIHIGDVGDIFISTDGGTTWSNQPSATTAAGSKLLSNLTCPSMTVCYAVGDSGTVINTTDGGVHWAPQSSGVSSWLVGVSCPTVLVCFVVGRSGKIINTTNGGSTWSAQASPVTGLVSGVSCPTTTRCFASVSNFIDPVMGTTSGPGQIIATSDGLHWSISFNVGNDPSAGVGANGQFSGISCPTTMACYAVGNDSLIAATSDGGINWRTDNITADGANAITCPSAAVCYAILGQEVLYTKDAGGSWDIQWAGVFGESWAAIACTSASACLVGGSSFAHTATSGAAWSRSMPAGSIGIVHGLACTDSQNCYATAEDALLSTHNGGTTWTSFGITTTDFLESMSCPAAGTCFAVGWPGAVYATADGGATWNYRSNPLSGADETLTGVSCAGPTTCVAVGTGGKVLSTTNGTTWTMETSGTAQFLSSVSCATSFNCVAVGTGGTALARSGGTWHAYWSGTTKALAGVDCPTAPVCYAVGQSGTLLKTDDGGGTWTAQSSGTTAFLRAIKCRTTAVCLAVGNSGTVIITLDGTTWSYDTPPPTYDALSAVAWGDLNNAWLGGFGGTLLVNNAVTDGCGSVTGGPTPPSTATVGTAVSISGAANGCPNPLYEFWMLPPGGNWTLARGWSKDATIPWDTSSAAAGSYRFSVWARDLSSSNQYDSFFGFSYTLTVTACTGISVVASPGSTSVQRGQPEQFSGSTTACPNPRYEFWILPPGGSWAPAQQYSASSTYYWSTFVPVGTYYFSVWVRDASSSNAYDAFSTFPFTITGNGCTGMAATAAPPSPTTRGMTPMFTGTATGCPYPMYEFWLRMPAGNWLLARGYSMDNIWDWSTSGQPTGNYVVSIWARDSSSTASYDAFSTFAYTLNAALPCTSVTAPPSPSSPSNVSTTVTIAASATGCSSPLFEFWLLPPGGPWTLAQGYFQVGPTFTWQTSGLTPGTYRFSVWARDAAGTSSYDAFTTFDYVLKTTPCTGMTATPSPASSASRGTPVTITGSATGCSSPQYEFWVLPPGGTWTLVRDYSASGTLSWITVGLQPGTYVFSVWVRDSSSNAAYDAFQTFNYTLT